MSISVADQVARSAEWAGRRNCLFILMNGGPSQLETWDPKPDAPAEIRGPLRSISTAVPGIQFCETMPRLAERANRFAVLRSLYHDAAPIHETGLQLIQTGRLAEGQVRHPHCGSVMGRFLGSRNGADPHVLLPAAVGHTGVHAYTGQQSTYLGHEFSPIDFSTTGTDQALSGARQQSGASTSMLPARALREYGDTRFGRRLLRARMLIEQGVRTVTVNLFEQLNQQRTWDCHGHSPGAPATLFDYRDSLCPAFDRALSALLDDLHQSNLLQDTLVVAVGEFGRTPHVNNSVGRDHWPGVWSALIAGAGVCPGAVVGSSDRHAAAPLDRPTNAAELVATIYYAMGLDPRSTLLSSGGTDAPLADAAEIHELFS
ncbi:MAG: DUF1501 domain-containing protein [Planctomycetaceae bacterium]